MIKIRYMGIVRWLAAAGILTLVACAGCGAAGDPDVHGGLADRATSEYLDAREALIRSSMADLPAGRDRMAAFVAHVRAGCSGALTGTPLDHVEPLGRGKSVGRERAKVEDARFVVEIERGLEGAQQTRQPATVQRFVKTTLSIRWNNPVVTDLVHTFIEIEEQRAGLASRVDVCGKIKEWASNGYRKPPVIVPVEPSGALAEKWTRDVAALGCGKFSPTTPREVLRALRPYQQAGGGPTTRHVEVMEMRLMLEEAQARTAAVRSLAKALGLAMTGPKHRKYRHPAIALKFPPEPPGCSGKPDVLSRQS